MYYNRIELDFMRAREFAQNNLSNLLEQARKDCAYEKYLVGASFLGMFDPSLIMSFIVDNYKKGKLVNSFPNKRCDVVWLNKDQKLLYMASKHIDPKFDNEKYLRIFFEDYVYYLYMFKDEFATFGASFRTKYIGVNPIEYIYYSGTERIDIINYRYNKTHCVSDVTIKCGPKINKYKYEFNLNSGKAVDVIKK